MTSISGSWISVFCFGIRADCTIRPQMAMFQKLCPVVSCTGDRIDRSAGGLAMIGDAIRLLLENIPIVMFIAAIAIAAMKSNHDSAAEKYLAWLLLLSVGVESFWGGFFHVFFPATASAQIGWQPSPFEFEIGISDLALGVTAIISFWRSLSFKSAVVVVATLSYAGVLIGHIRQAASGNFSPDNFGALQVITLIHVILLPTLVWFAWQRAREAAAGRMKR